ncbi:hypothetical protein MTO96_015935 [Rhipicephalus appendiculatus]
MDNVNTDPVDTQDTDVQELYRKGIDLFGDEKQSDRREDDTSAIAQDGAKVAYEKISEKEATVLRRLLRSGPPVKQLCLYDISLGAFKAAFDNNDECPWLSRVCVHIDLQGKELGTIFSGAFRGLHSLELICDKPGSGFASMIASYIRQNKSLRELRLRQSCGGDEGAAVLIEALVGNDTLEIFALNDITSSSDTLIGFAKMLTSNSTLYLVSLSDVCCVEVGEVWSLLGQERYAGVFERLDIVWPDELLSVLTELMRREAYYPALSVKVTSSVDEGVLREFFDAAAESKTLRRLYFESAVFDALANGIASVVKSTRTLREIYIAMAVQRGSEHQMITILDALKENTSITEFTILVETVTPEVATSLAELLAANKVLRIIHLCEEPDISPRIGETILQALWANYTLTGIHCLRHV